MSPNHLMTGRPYSLIAGVLLIALSCLALGGVLWEQGKKIERADAVIAKVVQGQAESRGFGATEKKHTRLLPPPFLVPLLFLGVLAGSVLLALRKISNHVENSIEGANQQTDEITSQGDAMVPAKLLQQQRSLARAERSAVATEFAASMSHDIRNPLAGIQMGLGNLIHESKDQALSESLNSLLSETNRITDLLTQAVAAARQRPEPSQDLDLVELVENLFFLLRLETPTGILLECDVEPDLQCHLPPNRLSHCLGNLLTNSIQAIGENQGRIHLELSARAEYLSFVIFDDGPGFPQDILSDGSRPRDSRNAGRIGLAMARRFVGEMGGRIQFSNGLPGGTESGARVAILLPSADNHG